MANHKLSKLARALMGGGAVATPKQFFLDLSSPTNGVITKSRGVVTINRAANPVINALFTAARTSGVAPLSVFFDATATTAPTRTANPYKHLIYFWDFGDGTVGTWANGCRVGWSKNMDMGPVANHVYPTAGTYTPTLVVAHMSDVGHLTYSATITGSPITVTAADVAFASNTICFSASTDHTGAPAGATLVNNVTDYGAAIAAYQGTKKRLLFRNGLSYSSATHCSINTDGPGLIGTYGPGAPARFTNSGSTYFLYMSGPDTPNIKDWRVMDLELDGQDLAASGINFYGGIDQTLFYNLNIHNVKSGFNNSNNLLDNWNEHATVSYHGHHLWDQLAVVDCIVNTVNGGVAQGSLIGAYLGATRHAMMGCNIDVAGGGEHAVRNYYIDRGVIRHNYFARPADTKHAWTLRGADQAVTGKVIGAGMSTKKVVAGNNSYYKENSGYIVTVAPTNTSIDERIEDVICESNYYLTTTGSGVNAGLLSRGSVSRLTCRNEIMNLTGAHADAVGYLWNGSTQVGGAPFSTGLEGLNNTVYRGDNYGTFVAYALGDVTGGETDYTIKNTLAYGPGTGTAYTVNGTIDSGLVTSNNSSNAQIKTSPLFNTIPTTAKQLVSTDFRPTSGSYAIGAGATVPLVQDALRQTRAEPFDIGAVTA